MEDGDLLAEPVYPSRDAFTLVLGGLGLLGPLLLICFGRVYQTACGGEAALEIADLGQESGCLQTLPVRTLPVLFVAGCLFAGSARLGGGETALQVVDAFEGLGGGEIPFGSHRSRG